MTLHNLHSVDTKQILFMGHLKTFRLFVCTWGWPVLSPSSLLSFTVSQDARSYLVGSWGLFFPFVSLSRPARSLSIVVFLIFPRTVKSSIYTVTKSVASHSWRTRMTQCMFLLKFVKYSTPWSFAILQASRRGFSNCNVGKLENLFQILRKFILICPLLWNHFWHQNLY